MTRNLAIGCNGSGSTYGSGYASKTLTSADSNVATNWSIPTAGTITGNSNTNAAVYSICPKGWRLPTGGSSGEFQTLYNNASYNTYAKMRAPYTSGGAAFALAGGFGNAAPVYQGSLGYYWSSTRYNNTRMYRLYFDTSSVYPADSNYRNRGFSIRCVLK